MPNANVALLGFVLTDGALDGVRKLDDGAPLDGGATLDGVGVSKDGRVSSGLASVLLTQAEHSNAATVASNPRVRRLTNRDLTGRLKIANSLEDQLVDLPVRVDAVRL